MDPTSPTNLTRPTHTCCSCSEAFCYDGVSNHLCGAYCMTTEIGQTNWCFTMLCLPLKIVICMPCHFGAIINTGLNFCCQHKCTSYDGNRQNKNYLC